MEWLWTNEKQWYDRWDTFNDSTGRGHYLQLSDWLFSYHVFGFETELLLGLENGEICLGYGVIKVKYSLFKFCVINCGPIIREGYESYLEEAINIFLNKSKREKAFYCHVCLPVMNEGSFPHGLPNAVLAPDSIFFSGSIGMLYKVVFSFGGFLWVNLEYINSEEKLESFKANTRRDIRASLRKGLSMVEAETYDQIREAYKAIEINAKEVGFVVRPWAEFKNYLLESHRKGFARFLMAYKDNDCKGVMLLLKVNRRYTYVMGGAKREKPDLLVGDFLQWNAMMIMMSEGMKGYDISWGGSKGVMDFKLSFDPTVYAYVQSRHWILSPTKFAIYSRLHPILIKNKKTVVATMKIIRKIIRN